MTSSSGYRDKDTTRIAKKLFWESFFQNKTTYFLAVGSRLISYTLINAVVPLFIAMSLQSIIKRNFNQTNHYVIWFLILSLISAILTGVGNYAITLNCVSACEYMQNKFFINYLDKDYEFYSNSFLGALGTQATRMKDLTTDYGRLVSLEIPSHISIVIPSLLIIAYNSIQLATITLVFIILILSFTLYMSRYRIKYRRELSISDSELNGSLTDAISHVSSVKSFSAQDYEFAKLQPSLLKWKAALRKVWMSSVPTYTLQLILTLFTISALLVISSNLYRDGSISIAIITLIQIYVLRVLSVVNDIGDSVKFYEQIMGACYQPVRTFLVKPKVTDLPKDEIIILEEFNDTISFKHLIYKYERDVKRNAVDDFSLVINMGEKIGLVGFSGSGKSTLTKLMLRFIDPSEGSIQIDNVDIRNISQLNLRSLIAYVPQDPMLFHRSLRENIMYGNPTASEGELYQVCESAYINEFINELPNNLETTVGERGIKLSGGQRQRIAIARAMLKDSPILILDEATSALDSISERYIQDALFKLMENKTALVIAHRLSTISRLDKIVVIDKGKIIDVGSHDELLERKSEIYTKLWSHQSGGYIKSALVKDKF